MSDVGKVRANNQDSGYSGSHLFVVADGMGGHAGGDVASAIATNRIREVDRDYPTADDAQHALQAAILSANGILGDTVFEHPELTGMGTTVSALLRVGSRIALAHIGDSRIYLYRDDTLEQVSVDHTFVQRLVDSGRITEEEALVHPRRSVLMRVLGDVDSSPEVDSWILETEAGDRWMLCSDGLTAVLRPEEIRKVLARAGTPRAAAERLVALSLDGGAPDNVTVVVVDIAPDIETEAGDRRPDDGVIVGSAAVPLVFDHSSERPRSTRIPALRLTPRPPDSHFEPQTQDYLHELIEEDARRARRRRITWTVSVLLLIGAIVTAVLVGRSLVLGNYYVGEAKGDVAIYQGVQQTLGPIGLSHVVEETTTPTTRLTPYERQQVRQTINAQSLADARSIVRELTRDGN